MESLGIQEIDVWRQDMTPPPGTVASVPPWLIQELAGFLSRGFPQHTTTAAAAASMNDAELEDQWLSILNPGYGGRASPRKIGKGKTLLSRSTPG